MHYLFLTSDYAMILPAIGYLNNKWYAALLQLAYVISLILLCRLLMCCFFRSMCGWRSSEGQVRPLINSSVFEPNAQLSLVFN